jgi:hypothetical protein
MTFEMSSSANTNPLAPSGTLVHDEDTQRVKHITDLTQHLEYEEFEKAVELHQQFREEIKKNPRKLRVFRRVLACLEADESVVSRVDEEHRAKHAELLDEMAARNSAKEAYWAEQNRLRKEEMKRKKATAEARIMECDGPRSTMSSLDKLDFTQIY